MSAPRGLPRLRVTETAAATGRAWHRTRLCGCFTADVEYASTSFARGGAVVCQKTAVHSEGLYVYGGTGTAATPGARSLPHEPSSGAGQEGRLTGLSFTIRPKDKVLPVREGLAAESAETSNPRGHASDDLARRPRSGRAGGSRESRAAEVGGRTPKRQRQPRPRRCGAGRVLTATAVAVQPTRVYARLPWRRLRSSHIWGRARGRHRSRR
ncbi:unnamed protein product [Lampetra fluviatilis]